MPTLSYACDFMMGLGKPQLYAKFEVPSFSHCVHIEVKPQNWGASLAKAMLTFPLGLILCRALVNLCRAKFEVASPSRSEIL